jgi:hypothetical protein
MTWHGWLWTRGRWQHVCQAPTLPECSRLLGRLCPQASNARLCLSTGAVPSHTPGWFPWKEE